MNDKFWTKEQLEILRENFETKSFKELSKLIGRSISGIKHKCQELELYKRNPQAKIGDIINGWKIIEIYDKNNIKYANVESTINDKKSTYRLTLLTNKQVGWPDRRRPDLSKKNTTHGQTGTRLYSIWNGMKNRCYNQKQLAYKNYGAKGIEVCQSWHKFENFHKWAIENGYSDTLTLDRINNKKDYKPSNCKWATHKEQNDHRMNSVNITAWNETKNASDWSIDSRCKTSYNSLIYRINAGWNPEDAILTQSRNKNDNFRRYKSLYSFIKKNYPEILQEFLNT